MEYKEQVSYSNLFIFMCYSQNLITDSRDVGEKAATPTTGGGARRQVPGTRKRRARHRSAVARRVRDRPLLAK